MTLAAILLVSIFSSLSAQPLVARPPIVLQINCFTDSAGEHAACGPGEAGSVHRTTRTESDRVPAAIFSGSRAILSAPNHARGQASAPQEASATSELRHHACRRGSVCFWFDVGWFYVGWFDRRFRRSRASYHSSSHEPCRTARHLK